MKCRLVKKGTTVRFNNLGRKAYFRWKGGTLILRKHDEESVYNPETGHIEMLPNSEKEFPCIELKQIDEATFEEAE